MHRESTSFVVGEPQPPPTQLASEDSILFDEVGHALLLPAAQPSGQSGK